MQLVDKSYQIQGLPVIELCKKYGLPLFVYDGQRIEEQYHRLSDAFDVPKIRFHYACKALSNVSILRLIRALGAGVDVVSIGEILLALQAGFQPDDIMYTPSSVSIAEYEEAMKHSVRINVDNLERLEYFGKHFPDQPICIRINPHIMAGGNKKISVGHIDSKFGISIHQIGRIRELVDQYKISVEGLHMHTGSDILDVDVFLAATDVLFAAAREFPEISFIDFGSGFKVKYRVDDNETNIELFGQEMSRKFRKYCREVGKELQLIFEPGKFLVSEAGYFFVKTNLVKHTTSTVFAGVDSGFNHLIRPMFYDAHHEIENISNPTGLPKIYSVVGYICETDTFAWNRKIPEIREGDILVFRNAGAYSFQMASNYNSRLIPAEVLLYQGQDYLIRERQDFDDLIRHQTDPEIPFIPR